MCVPSSRVLVRPILSERGGEACLEFDFRPHRDLDTLLAARSTGTVSSQMCEDAFNFQKNSKVIRGKKKFRRPEKSWGVGLARKVMSSVHHYTELVVEDALKLQSVRMPRSSFAPEEGKSSMQFGEVVSTSSTAPWYSPGPPSFCQAHADLQLLLDCHSAGDWKRASLAWLGRLCLGQHRLLVQSLRTSVNSPWLFALHHWADSSVLCWPALERKIVSSGGPSNRDVSCYELDVDGGRPMLISIVDVVATQAMTYTWRSPAWQAVAFPASKAMPMAIRAFVDDPPADLKTVAARKAFWGLERSFVQRFGAHIGVEVPDGSNLLDTLVCVIQGALCCDLDRALGIVQQRMGVHAMETRWCDDLLEIEEASSLLDRHDGQVLTEQKQRVVQSREEAVAFQRTYAARRASARSTPSTGRAPKKQAVSAKKLGLRANKIPPIGAIEHADAKAWAPPTASVWRGLVEGTWQGHMPPFGRISRSWSRYGEEEALRLVLVQLWQNYCILQGLSFAECPLQGLLSDGEAGGPLAAAGSSSASSAPRS